MLLGIPRSASLRTLCSHHLQIRQLQFQSESKNGFSRRDPFSTTEDDLRFIYLLTLLRVLNPRKPTRSKSGDGPFGHTQMQFDSVPKVRPNAGFSRISRVRDQRMRFSQSSYSLQAPASMSFQPHGDEGTELDPGAKGEPQSDADMEMTWDILCAESSFWNAQTSAVPKMVDLPENRNNYQLWAKLLRFRWRVHSVEGIDEVWHGLKERNVVLPGDVETDGDATIENRKEGDDGTVEYIWTLLVRRVPPDELFAYAMNQKMTGGPMYSGLYVLLLGRVATDAVDAIDEKLRRGDIQTQRVVDAIAEWHVAFEKHYFIPRFAFQALVSRMANLRRLREVTVLREVYLRLRDRPTMLYDNGSISTSNLYRFDMENMFAVLPFLHSAGFGHEAYIWEKQLKQKEYWPSIFMKNEAFPFTFGLAAERTKEVESFKDPIIHIQSSNHTSTGASLGIKPVLISQDAVSDDLLARLFATRALTINTIGAGLALLVPGIQLGPQVIREVGLRFKNEPLAFLSALQTLRQKGIRTRPSAFTTALVALAETGVKEKDMFNRLLAVDQDAQNFDDSALQQQILSRALCTGKVLEALPILVVMAIAVGESRPSAQAWNTVLVHQTKNLRITSSVNLVEQMIALGQPVFPYSIDLLEECCLGPRVGAPGTRDEFKRQPPDRLPPGVRISIQKAAEADAKLLVSLWQKVLLSRSVEEFDPSHWANVMKRLGGLGCWDDLVRLTMWLAEWYSPSKQPDDSNPAYNVLARDRMWKWKPMATLVTAQTKRETGDGIKPGQVPSLQKPGNCFEAELHKVFSPAMQRAIVVWGFRKGWKLALEWTRRAEVSQRKEQTAVPIGDTEAPETEPPTPFLLRREKCALDRPGNAADAPVANETGFLQNETFAEDHFFATTSDSSQTTPSMPDTCTPTKTAFKTSYPEWELIAELESRRKVQDCQHEGQDTDCSNTSSQPSRPRPWEFTAGIRLLSTLAERGVVIDIAAVEKSIVQVLWTMYGAGVSARSVNRKARLYAADLYCIEEVLDEVENEMKRIRSLATKLRAPNRTTVGGTGGCRRSDRSHQLARTYEHGVVSRISKAIVNEMETRKTGIRTMPEGELIESRIQLVKAVFGETPKIYANPVSMGEEEEEEGDGEEIGGVNMRYELALEPDGDDDHSEVGNKPELDATAGTGPAVSREDWQERKPFQVEYPPVRKWSRILPGTWNRAVAKWAVNGNGPLDLSVESEFSEGGR